jgi:hypothetical protein
MRPCPRVVVPPLALALLLATTASVRADGPTSGDLSVLSGRTLGKGDTALSAGAGWPGLWAQMTFAPRSTLNVGVRAALLYGSPIMGFGTGVGGEVSVPVRMHLLGRGDWDLAMAARPYFVTGRATLVGADDSVFGDQLGWAAMMEKGLLAGWRATDALTLTLGVLTAGGVVGVPDANRTRFAFHVLGVLGLELLLARDALLFVHAEGGGGHAGSEAFSTRGIVRLSAGFAHMF